VRIVGRKDFVNVDKKNIEREPVNAVFLLAEMCASVPPLVESTVHAFRLQPAYIDLTVFNTS
jgi:hypothetical protein